MIIHIEIILLGKTCVWQRSLDVSQRSFSSMLTCRALLTMGNH